MKPNIPLNVVRAGLTLLALVLCVGCGGSKALQMRVVGTPQLNSAETGSSNAAVVRIYELTSPTNFQTATPEAFWRNDVEAIGDELVKRQELLLYPDSTERIEFEPEESTQFIGVAADLRRPDQEGWRQVIPVDQIRGKYFTIEVGADRVAILTQ